MRFRIGFRSVERLLPASRSSETFSLLLNFFYFPVSSITAQTRPRVNSAGLSEGHGQRWSFEWNEPILRLTRTAAHSQTDSLWQKFALEFYLADAVASMKCRYSRRLRF